MTPTDLPHRASADAAGALLNLTAAGIPAAVLAGDWFGAEAVVVPHAVAAPRPDDALFPGPSPADAANGDDAAAPAAPPGSPDAGAPASGPGPGPDMRLGWRPYSGASFGCTADRGVLVLAGGRWENRGVDPDVARIALAGPPPHGVAPVEDPPIDWDHGDRAAHLAGVESCLEAIRAGEVYQACLSTRFHGTFAGDVLDVAARWFAARLRRFRPARSAFLPGRDAAGRTIVVASLSPEEFLVRDGDVVRETPIKGTVPLDRDPAELLASRKDVAENIMIVDLVRHDLGQVARTGGVTVPDLLSVSPAPGVWHLHSTVRAELPPSLPHRDLVAACFPPASVTGTPKRRAAELIDVWEPEPRGVHCGAIGASCGGRLELAVAIRTAEFREAGSRPTGRPEAGSRVADLREADLREADLREADLREAAGAPRGVVEAGVGGGITIDSTPDGEWAEVLAKAAPLFPQGPSPGPGPT